MKKLSLVLLGLIAILLPSFGDNYTYPELRKTDANIVGHVVDKNSQEHLSFITISIKGTTIGTQTDKTGHYFLKNLPEGKYTLEASAVGYKTQSKEVILKKGKTLNIKFEIQEDLIQLDGVVVSANRNETKRRLAPTLVNVVNLKMFENTNSPTLAEGLNFQPGVRTENNCQNCGFTQVRINGLDGPYTQILMDSRAIFSALTGVYGLEQIPASMIERVEVMRGGGSALFGSSAIAGTINIITKEPNRNSGQISHTLGNMTGSSIFDNNTSLNLSMVTDDHKAGLFIFGQNRHRSGYDHDGDGFTELPKLKSQTIGLRSYLKTSDYSKLTFEYHHINEFRRGGNKLELPPHMTDLTEQIQHSIDGGGLTFDMFSPDEKHKLSIYTSAQNTDRDSYYSGYGKTDGLNALGGAQYTYNFDKLLFMPSELTGGAEYSYEHLRDKSYKFKDHIIDQSVNIASAYLQNEWKNEKWGFLVGGRLDKHNFIDHAIFSPRANLRYNPTKNINFRLSYSGGFRAPQAFDEDLHIGNVGEEKVSVIKIADDLKEERSNSFSASVDMYHRFGDFQANLLIEGFLTRLNNPFTLVVSKNQPNPNERLSIRTNGSGAQVNGLTVEGKIAYLNLFQFQAGMTFQKSLYKKAEEWGVTKEKESLTSREILRTPNTYGYFTATYTPIKPLSIALSGTYTGHMYVPHVLTEVTGGQQDDALIKSRDFFELGFKTSYKFALTKVVNMEVNAGIQNIFNAYQNDFDKGASRDSGYIYGPSSPRSIFLGTKIMF